MTLIEQLARAIGPLAFEGTDDSARLEAGRRAALLCIAPGPLADLIAAAQMVDSECISTGDYSSHALLCLSLALKNVGLNP